MKGTIVNKAAKAYMIVGIALIKRTVFSKKKIKKLFFDKKIVQQIEKESIKAKKRAKKLISIVVKSIVNIPYCSVCTSQLKEKKLLISEKENISKHIYPKRKNILKTKPTAKTCKK